MTPQKTEPNLPASVGGSPVGCQGLNTGTRALAAAVWEDLPWHKPSWRLPLAQPYWGFSFGTMWHPVHADWSPVSSGPIGALACGMLRGESLLPAWASRQPEGELMLTEAESPQDPTEVSALGPLDVQFTLTGARSPQDLRGGGTTEEEGHPEDPRHGGY